MKSTRAPSHARTTNKDPQRKMNQFPLTVASSRSDLHERRSGGDRLARAHVDLPHDARGLGPDLVLHLHRLDDEELVLRRDLRARSDGDLDDDPGHDAPHGPRPFVLALGASERAMRELGALVLDLAGEDSPARELDEE